MIFCQAVPLAYQEIKRSGEMVFPGLGKTAKRQRAARMGRHPVTGETFTVPAGTVLQFVVAKAAKEASLSVLTRPW